MSDPSPAPRGDGEPSELSALHRGYDITAAAPPRTLGDRVRALWRRLLMPVLRQQTEYNAANARLQSAIVSRQADMAGIEQALRSLSDRTGWVPEALATFRAESVLKQENLERQYVAMRTELQEAMRRHSAAIDGLADAMRARLDELGSQQERALDLMRREHLRALQRIMPSPTATSPTLTASSVTAVTDDGWLDPLHATFEDEFRGTRASIRERLEVYMPHVRKSGIAGRKLPSVDLGCGRGEWLELMAGEGIAARGVESNRVLAEECRRRGLEVVEADVLAYLKGLPAESIGAVTGFHIVEHLPFDVLIRLFDEVVRVLAPGGLAIFETPNPANLRVGSDSFYLDPTHRNPIPSRTLSFLARSRGLLRIEVIELNPGSEADRLRGSDPELVDQLNRHLSGPMDYAIVGWR